MVVPERRPRESTLSPGGGIPRDFSVPVVRASGAVGGRLLDRVDPGRDAIGPALLTDNNPADDLELGLFFLGSLGSNVSSTDLDALRGSHPCGPSGGWLVSRSQRRQFPARCRRLICDYCLPREASIRQLIIAESMPDTAWSVTLVADADDPDPCKTATKRMNLFKGYYKRQVGHIREFAWTIEMNPQSTGYHMHAVCWGPRFDMVAYKKALGQAGLGEHGNDIGDIGLRHDAAGYGMKGFQAAGYGLKGFQAPAQRREALRINGGHLLHKTKNFYRVNGITVDLRTARRAIMKKKYGELSDDVYFSPEPLSPWLMEHATWTQSNKRQSALDDL